MIFSKIFKIFLLFLLFPAVLSAAKDRSFYLNEHCQIEFTPTNELVTPLLMEYAREVNNRMTAIFPGKDRRTEKKKHRKFTIFISDDTQKTMTVKSDRRNITISLGGVTPDFPGDYRFLHNLFSAVAIQAIPYEQEKVRTNWKLPHWFFLALHSKVKNAFTGQKILRSSKTIPGVRLFLEKNFFPDPLQIESCNGELMSNIEIFFIQDYCRLLLDLCTMYANKEPNAAGIYLRELYLAENSSDPAVFQRIIIRFLQKHAELHLKRMLDDPSKYTEKEQLDIFLKFHAGHLAFSYSSPAPANYLKQRFQELKKVRFTEIGKDRKPTGKIIESTIDQLPVLIRKYPIVVDVLHLKRGELLYFRSIASSFLTAEANDLIELLANVKDSWLFGTSQSEIRKSCQKLEEKIAEFEKIELFLEKTETENLSPFQIFPHEFSIEKEHRNITVPESFLHKLEEAEKSYLN